MFDKTMPSDLKVGIARAQRLIEFVNSDLGEDLRRVLIDVARVWLDKMKQGDPHAFEGLRALDAVVNNFELTISIGEGMQAELIRRQGGNNNADDHARALAD